ncbi:MAG: ATP-binding protein [Myxococcales bacterium]|nr:ATP-binding protein [Myxococcales bacterium]
MAMHGVIGLSDGWIDLTRTKAEPARLVAIAGPPSSGKTRLLETLVAAKEAAAPYGPTPSSNDWIASGKAGAKVTVEWWLDADEIAYAGTESAFQTAETSFAKDKLPRTSADPGLTAILARYDHAPETAKVDYFPADRAIPRLAPKLGNVVAHQRLVRLAAGPHKYGALVKWATELARTAALEWQRLTELFERLTRGRRVVAPSQGPGLAFETSRGELVDVHQLGNADRMAFLFAAGVLMVGLERSVVLVDTPELHLPPEQSSRMLAELLAACPSSQWIVATHDPRTIEMAETVVHLGERR